MVEDSRAKADGGQTLSEGRSTVAARLAAAAVRRARVRQEGEALFRRLRDHAVREHTLKDLAVTERVTDADVEEAWRRCGLHWDKSSTFAQDVNFVVLNVMERCSSMMEADGHFRGLLTKVGRELPGQGLLTDAVIQEARARCHTFWSKVTPGNVVLIMKNITEKCETWSSADKKFDWLWRKGEWSADGNSVQLSGRTFSREDLEEAERQCRRRFGLKPQKPGARSQSAGPATVQAKSKDTSPKKPRAVEASSASAAHRAPAVKPPQSNSDFLVDHIVKKCDGMQAAMKFFNWLRSKPGTQAKGRTFSTKDIDVAQKKCESIWKKQKQEQGGKKKVVKAAPSESSGSESDSSDHKAKARRTKSSNKPRGVPRPVAVQQVSKSQRSALLARPASDACVDMIVRYALRKCDGMVEASRFFDDMYSSAGQRTSLGREFTNSQITEAYIRVEHALKSKQKACGASDDDASSSDEDSDSSSSSQQGRLHRTQSGKLKRAASMDLAGGLKRQKTKKGKGLRRRGTSGILGDEEYEGALFGSDSDDLSGEEALDEEDEGDADAPELLSGFAQEDAEDTIGGQEDDDHNHAHWQEESADILPGYEGFNKRATAVMQKAGIGDIKLEVHFDTLAACPPLQPHQESVGYLVHPKSPVRRLLVDHPTGSGKTREMIKVLNNFFFDPRPKIPVFPKDPVCRNFYAELLRWPSKYRDFFCCISPEDAKLVSSSSDWRERRFHMWDITNFREEELRRLCHRVREVLDMKGMILMGRVRKDYRRAFNRRHPGEFMPAAPLRALGYTSAGGCFSQISENGKPLSAIMKIGYERGSGNVYSNKIVLMDEAHNLVRTQTQYAEQLQRLRDLLFTARNLVLVGFTGTPILNEPSEGRHLLDIIKGYGAPEGDEGFLSSFPMRPRPLFPMTLPRGLPDGVLTLKRKRQLIKKVELHGEALKVYDWKRRGGAPARRLRAYCNVCTFFGSFHEGKSGSKTKVLTFPEDCCPKFYAIAQAVASSPEKAVVMTSRLNGYNVMLELMRSVASKVDPPFGVASLDELAEYNSVSNLHGEKYRVLVADAAICSEGVSFLAVRRSFLCDVPVSPSAFIQQCGRAIRMYGHRGLGHDEQVVETTMYVSSLPKWMRAEALGCWAYRAQKKMASAKQLEKKAKVLTARLNRAGIRTLADLRTRLQEHGRRRKALPEGSPDEARRAEATTLTTEDVITFLEHNGVWEEARLLRNAEKKEQERATATAATKEAIAKAVEDSGGALLRSMTTASMESIVTDGEVGGETQEEVGDDKALDELDDFTNKLGEVLEAEEAAADSGEVAHVESATDRVAPLAAADQDPDCDDISAAEAVPQIDGEGEEGTAPEAQKDMQEEAAEVPEEQMVGEEAAGYEAQLASADPKAGGPEEAPAAASEDGQLMPLEALDKALSMVSAAIEQDARQKLDEQATGSQESGVREQPSEAALVRAQEERKLLNNLLKLAEASGPVAAALKASGCIDGVSGQDQLNALQAELARMQRAAIITKALNALAAAKEVIVTRGLVRPKPPKIPKGSVQEDPASVTDVQQVEEVGDNTDTSKDHHVEKEASAVPTEDPPVESPSKKTRTDGSESAAPVEGQEEAQTAQLPEPEPSPADEAAWRHCLDVGGLEAVLHSEALSSVFTAMAPQSMLGPSDKGLQTLTASQVLRLHEELLKEQAREEVSVARPRALVRAMQVLFASATLEEAVLTMSTETADEEALRQLEERSREFAPALTAMRSLAVDHEVFAHLADELEDEEGEVSSSESEASDIDKELAGSKESSVVLPEGWSMEWVKRKKREAREFLDPAGRRYYSAREVRAAIEQWKAAEDAKAARVAAEAASAAEGEKESLPPVKRVRLTKKTANYAPLPSEGGSLEAALEEAFGEAFADALAGPMDEAPPAAELPQPQPALARLSSTASLMGSSTLLAVQAGALVELKGLVARPDLNGRTGRLVRFNEESGRWECDLDSEESVNVRPTNFEVRGPPLQVAKRGKAGAKRGARKREASEAMEQAPEDDEVAAQADAGDGHASDSD